MTADAPAPEDFPRFFTAVYGYEPFAWQVDLAERVLSGRGWPAAVDVPTGMGKTAVLDIAVYALACQADRDPADRTAPTRTFMVVDRRVIVDQAFDRAHALAARLEEELTDSRDVTGQVARALQRLAGGGAPPLAVVRMRGGVTWASRWLESPGQPAVIAGTVDQYGSRLLFRGYGVSQEARPIDAALCGADRLLFLDEAHISTALVTTAVKAREYESQTEHPVLAARCPRPVVMSATLPRGADDVYRLEPDRETSAAARARLLAEKRVTPIDLVTGAKEPARDVARAMVEVVLDRLGDPGLERVGVVCNTVALARQVHRLLTERVPPSDLCLLIGRCREIDREVVAAAWAGQLTATPHREVRATPLVAVATQTVEVGADFDFDLLVTEASPLDSLLQRLGRLNRLGRTSSAPAIVIRSERRHAETDPVYGAATSRTWEWLAAQVGGAATAAVGSVAATARAAAWADLGLLAATQTLAGVDVSGLLTERPPTPVVLGPIIDGWSRTHPAPSPDQPVGPFLHGVGRDVPQVQVCWRAGLPAGHDRQAQEVWAAELDAIPVTSREVVEVPIWEVRRFLAGSPLAELADLEGVGPADEGDVLEESVPVEAWIRRGEELLRASSQTLRPGDLVVVPSHAGGHDQWGWTGEPGQPVPDVADLLHELHGYLAQRSPSIRLRPEVIAGLLGDAAEEWRSRLSGAVILPTEVRRLEIDFGALALAIEAHPVDGESPLAPKLKAVVRHLRKAGVVPSDRRDPYRATARVVGTEEAEWVVVIGPWSRRPALRDSDGDQSEASSSVAARRVSLEEHLVDVGERAAVFGRGIGLPDDLVAALELAGRAHDLGKADLRFQAMLYGGYPERAETAGVLLAKSGIDPADRRAFRAAQDRSGWPKGMRHEVLSTRLLRQWLDAEPGVAAKADRDLVLHLVAAHHGRGRPLFPAMLDPAPQRVTAIPPGGGFSVAIEPDPGLVEWEGPARFIDLNRRYGWWGLALLEATLRLADIACSAEYTREVSA